MELPAVTPSASAEQLGERRSNRKKKGRKARSMRDIRREVRRERAVVVDGREAQLLERRREGGRAGLG